ncbi:MAG TPA: TetR/AcrR family transcriptional regulator [Thermoleophilaceae bacterium]
MTQVAAPTRERIVEAATRLFAEKGYRDTTVGEIEEAAGLAPRRGALYKHFSSKEELFSAAVEIESRKLDDIELVTAPSGSGDLREELLLIGRWSLRRLAGERVLLQVVEREGHRFPQLTRDFYERIVQRGHNEAVAWIRAHVETGALPDMDVEARAVVAVASLVNYERMRAMFGEVPLGVDEERFLEAWVESMIGNGGSP